MTINFYRAFLEGQNFKRFSREGGGDNHSTNLSLKVTLH